MGWWALPLCVMWRVASFATTRARRAMMNEECGKPAEDLGRTSPVPPSVSPGTAPGNTRARQSADLANLDFLRAVAVGLVLVGHLCATMRIRGAGDLGHFGVL